MYLVIRCPGCRSFTYMDHLQQWKLCPVCGEVIGSAKVSVYMEVEKYTEADQIVAELEAYLKEMKRGDLTDDEIARLRATYAAWVKAHGVSYFTRGR